ncbi:50S ribosomal protein L1 [bacterium G20]|nr:50S ribosomal protein L1 [bacterium G20]
MVDKKTGLKPKKAESNKQKVKSTKAEGKPKAKSLKVQKIETSKMKLEKTVTGPSQIEPEVLIPNSELLVTAEPKATAKAGRRSAKAIAEAEAEKARQERKAQADKAEAQKPKAVQKPARSRAERAGKKYRQVAKLIEKDKPYTLAEALDLAVKTSTTKFDATVELHVNLGVDPKQADQNVRDNVTLPAGTGKNLRVAVFAEGENLAKAKAAGADIAGEADLLAQLDKDEINFDVLITSPNLMARLGKYAKLLGPKGLMPNPKSGTITTDIPKAIQAAKAGRVEYRVDPAGIVHLGVGKVSFGADKLSQNADVVLASIRAAKPSSLKGNYINSIYVTTSMGPSIKVAG